MSITAPSPARTADSPAARSVPAPTAPDLPRATDPQVPGRQGMARRRVMAQHPAGSGRRLAASRTRADAVAPAPLGFPTMADVHRLALAHHPLSVSLLMSTTPGARMTPDDRARLQALARDADRRLADESDRRAAAAVRAALAAAMARASAGPTDRGLAILASPDETHVHHLRVRPQDRVVLDPTFATRDLVRSTSEDPPFWLLVVDGRAARLVRYDQRYSRPVLGHDFPLPRPAALVGDRASIGSIDRIRREQVRSFLREVDSRLAARVAEDPLPVVLVATERIAAEFLSLGRSRRIAAVLRTGRTRVPLSDLEAMARSALTHHVTDRAAAALDAIHARLRQRRAVAGLAGAWDAMLWSDPEVLVVERSYAAAARVTGAGFVLAEHPEEPGVIDDAVDELIEATLVRGGEVVMVPDGALAHHGRLVLATRGRVPTWRRTGS